MIIYNQLIAIFLYFFKEKWPKVHIPLVYDLVGMKKNKINEFNYNKFIRTAIEYGNILYVEDISAENIFQNFGERKRNENISL